MSPSYISPLLPFAPLLTIIPHSIQHARSFLHYPPTRSVIFTVFQCFVLYLGRIADESPSPILFLPLFVLATFCVFVFLLLVTRCCGKGKGDQKRVIRGPGLPPLQQQQTQELIFRSLYEGGAIKSVSFVDLGRPFCYFPRLYKRIL